MFQEKNLKSERELETQEETTNSQGSSADGLWKELEAIRGCWNIYVDDDGNRHPHCPRCTEDVELAWASCPNCGYPDSDLNTEEDEEEIRPAEVIEYRINWKKGGF